MKPITWLRKHSKRSVAEYPLATLIFYGPDDRRAIKAVLGITDKKEAEPRLYEWSGEVDKDLRHNVSRQKEWAQIIQSEGVKSLVMMEEINGCPHEEGVDYPEGESCPKCPFWDTRLRPTDVPPNATHAIANYDPAQWTLCAQLRRIGILLTAPGRNGIRH
jgi:hypothetical protein